MSCHPTADDRIFTPKRRRGVLFRLRRSFLIGLIMLWAAALVASHTPPQRLPELPMDGKVLHVLGYFGLASVFLLALASYGTRWWVRNLVVLLAMVAYAALDEGTQPYFHRHGCMSDVMLDTCSAALALVTWLAFIYPLKSLACRVERWEQMERKVTKYLDPR